MKVADLRNKFTEIIDGLPVKFYVATGVYTDPVDKASGVVFEDAKVDILSAVFTYEDKEYGTTLSLRREDNILGCIAGIQRMAAILVNDAKAGTATPTTGDIPSITLDGIKEKHGIEVYESILRTLAAHKLQNVVVTGGGGFIGSYVVEELLRRGYNPIILDHHQHKAEGYPNGVELFYGDVRDSTHVTEAIAHADGWIHLAACLGTQETIQNPYPAAETNLLGGLNVLQAAAQYKVPGVYIAVGNWWMNNPYSITKNMIERFVHMYNKDRGTQVNIVRAVNAYGPRQLAAAPFGPGKVRKITPAFVCRALSGMPIEVYGDGKQVSDMVYVGDVAKALVNALERASDGEVFDKAVECGPEEHKTVGEVAKLVQNIASTEYGVHALNIVNLPMRPGETAGSKVIADTETLKLVGMDPKDLVTVEEGMAQTVKYFAEQKGKSWNPPTE